MTALFITILNMSITASVVALAVMLARVPLRKAPKVFSYALWGVVLFRLVFPFSIESIFSLMPTAANVIPQDITVSQNPVIHTGIQFIDVAVNNALPTVATENSISPIHLILEIAGYVWVIGFIALLLYAIIGYVRLKRRVYFATLVKDNIFETDKIKTPFVFGFICPKIYFPITISPTQYDYIIKHEQTHIKRRDYLIKPFAYIVFALHWFNPLMWLSYFLMSKDMEMSCDEAVLRKTNEDIRGEYSTTLLNLATEKVSLLNPIAFSYGESNVKARVINVLKFKKPAKWVIAVSFITMFIFLIGFASNEVVAVGGDMSQDRPRYAHTDEATDLLIMLTHHINYYEHNQLFNRTGEYIDLSDYPWLYSQINEETTNADVINAIRAHIIEQQEPSLMDERIVPYLTSVSRSDIRRFTEAAWQLIHERVERGEIYWED